MHNTGTWPQLAHASNGVETPLYFDRQIVRAEDLTLDRSSRDTELARMRRYLHGWGVVAGLIPVIQDGVLAVTPGYGVTPSGDELFLSAPLLVEGPIEAKVRARCGPGERGCELPADEDDDDDPGKQVDAWLIARPLQRESALRPGVPAGCQHPTTTLMPSRSCNGVVLGLMCSLPESHQLPPADCGEISRTICGTRGRPPIPVPFPPALDPEAEFLVLGRLQTRAGGVLLSLHDRRRLLPVSVLQEWIGSCGCVLAGRMPGDDGPVDGGAPLTGPRWNEFTRRLRENGFAEPGTKDQGVPRLPRLLADIPTIAALEDAGIDGPQAFLGSEPQELAEATGLAVEMIALAQQELDALAVFFSTKPF